MKFETKFKILLLKGYFDTGWGLLNYVKYIIAIVGFATMSWRLVVVISFFYGIACFVIGYLWFKYKWVEASAEVGNRFNPFVGEVREHIQSGQTLKKEKFK